MNPHYPVVAARALHRCEYCHAPESVFNFPFEVEHILPAFQGGTDVISNLALACRSCNLHKGVHTHSADPESDQRVRLFDPRKDLWTVHFDIDRETGNLIGMTATGRASVVCLNVNSQAQLLARQQWMSLGLFP